MLEVEVGVDLGRRQVAVPEKLLDTAQVAARLEEMGGAAVAEKVRVDTGVDALAVGPAGETPGDPASAQATATRADEEGRLIRGGLRRAHGEPELESLAGRATDRQDPGALPLARDTDESFAEVEIGAIDRDEFTHPERGRVEKLEKRAVEYRLGVDGGKVEQAADKVGVENLGEWPRLTGGTHVEEGGTAPAFPGEMTEETADGGQFAGEGAGAAPRSLPHRYEGADVFGVDRRPVPTTARTNENGERLKGASVGRETGRGQSAGGGELVEDPSGLAAEGVRLRRGGHRGSHRAS